MIYPPNIIIDFKSNTVNKDYALKWSVQNHTIKEFKKEKQCLTLLEKNFINEPKINYYPFPKLINSEKFNITMSYCGNALKLLEKQLRNNKIDPKQWCNDLDVNNIYNTIECIITNLKLNTIKHNDINKKNICIDENNNIYLIDFEGSDIGNIEADPFRSGWQEKHWNIHFNNIRKKILSMFNIQWSPISKASPNVLAREKKLDCLR